MKKILYLMHVDWRWIKQRPHFIAEELSKDYEVHVVYRHRYTSNGMQLKRIPDRVKLHPVYTIPMGDRFRLTYKINYALLRIYVKTKIAQIKPDWIYVCYPGLWNCIKGIQENIIYDCMDDHVLLTSDDSKLVLTREMELLQKAKLVLASSMYIKDVVLPKRNCPQEKITLIRNGYNSGDCKLTISSAQKNKDKFHLCYIGTISSWFNLGLIERSLDTMNNIVYDMAGPVSSEIMKKNCHSNIKFHGTVEHSVLSEFVQSMDCLIMPFVVNDIVKAVDPVKLYEYINFGKCIISVWYPELERFSPFVYFYRNETEYLELIKKLVDSGFPPKYTEEERTSFLAENSWEARYEVIKEQLKKVE